MSYTYLNFDDRTPEKLLEHIEKGGIAIDFSFAEIKTQIDILQNDIKFPSFTISGGSKIFPKLEYAADPNQSGIYGFFGYINQDMNGIYLQRRPEFKTPLKFHKHDREFLVFKAKKQIKDREEYAGLSGAPIFDFNGNLTALACAVKVRTNMVYGFPLTFGRHLIDIAIDTNQI